MIHKTAYHTLQNVYHNLRNLKNMYHTLETRIKSLLEKYKDDREIREKILSQLDMYRVNIAIAKECNDKKAVVNCRKEFNQFLNQF